MIPLHSILAAGGLENLPMIIFVVMGIVVALAFVMGFVKGFRKVSWDGLAWLVASVVFVVIGILVPMTGSTPAGGFAITITVAIVCTLATLGIFGVLSYFLRPKMRWIKDDINGDMSLAEYGLEFEPEYLDYDGEHDYAPYGKRIYKTGYGTPSFFFRLLGGLTCGINIGIVLWAFLSVFLLIVDVTALKDMAVGAVLNDETMKLLLIDARNCLFEVVSIGIILVTAKQGYNKGFINSLRTLIITIGSIGAVILSFYLPFSEFAAEGFLATAVARCTEVFESTVLFRDILGKLLTGICLLALCIIVLVLLNLVLRNVCSMIENIGITRELDCCLAAVLYTIIGAAICVGLWFVFAALDILGIFPIEAMLSDQAYLSSNLLKFAKSILEPLFAGAGA